jgi:phospholipid/cholesterol/gamma-HCH transport system ATP-binding protein
MSRVEDVAVRFDRVSKSIGATRILEDVSFEVPRGTAFSILGRRGAGKTIVLKLSIGLLKPDRGRIFVNNDDITALDHSGLLQVRKSIGFVFQQAAVFDSISVAENIAFPLRCISRKPESELHERVRQQLLQVGLEQDIDRMPNDLSVGMRKLLGFARALACDPAILLLDDPWSGIDSVSVALVRDRLLSLKQRRGATLLIAANKMTEVRSISEQLGVLDGGHMIACGSPNEVARSDHPVVRQFVLQQDF